jgi:hypothetical protein
VVTGRAAPSLVKQIEKRRLSLRRRAAQQGAKLYRDPARRVEARIAARLKELNRLKGDA